MPFKARNGANSGRRFPAKSGPEDLSVSRSAEGVTGAHSARTPGPPATGESRRRNETNCAVYRRTKTKDGVNREDVEELRLVRRILPYRFTSQPVAITPVFVRVLRLYAFVCLMTKDGVSRDADDVAEVRQRLAGHSASHLSLRFTPVPEIFYYF